MDFLLATRATQQFIEQMPVAIAIFDDEMRYRAASHRYLSEMAWLFSTEVLPPEKVIGRTVREVSPNMPPRWGDAHERVLAGEELAKEEDFVPRQDGRVVWVRWAMKPWRDSHGRIAGALLFSELVTEQVEIRHALHESESRFRATFENAAVGIAHMTPEGRYIRFNKAMSRILGWPADELFSKSIQELTYPDDLLDERAHCEQLRDGEVDSYSMDKRDMRKDGTTVWVRRTVSVVRRSDGSIDYYVSVVEDISPRKRAEEQVRLLMREAKHRVRNLLGLVQTIARQTVAAGVKDYIARLTERIEALAANQDLLGRDERRGADLEELVRAQLAPLADLVGSRIVFRGPKLQLNAAAGQAVGLALHELATNAGKYGALSTDAGCVYVGWKSEGGAFMVSWKECDGPPVRPPQRQGFGTTVIDAMARLNLGGDVERDYAPSGLAWRLTCPAANALERAAEGLC
jgi:PAS domain S-box-containing protein